LRVNGWNQGTACGIRWYYTGRRQAWNKRSVPDTRGSCLPWKWYKMRWCQSPYSNLSAETQLSLICVPLTWSMFKPYKNREIELTEDWPTPRMCHSPRWKRCWRRRCRLYRRRSYLRLPRGRAGAGAGASAGAGAGAGRWRRERAGRRLRRRPRRRCCSARRSGPRRASGTSRTPRGRACRWRNQGILDEAVHPVTKPSTGMVVGRGERIRAG